MTPYRLLIADDQPGFLALAREMFSGQPWFEVVATAPDGESALKAADESRPDVAVVDVFMPGISGFQTAKRLREAHPACRVVVVSAEGYPDHPRLAREAGALGFLDKRDLRPRRLLELLQRPLSP
jgi:two-component system response regulator DesR